MESSTIRAEYVGNSRDTDVFNVTDARGIQIIRKYPDSYPELKDLRMFIKFFLNDENGETYVNGGVDMVKTPENASFGGWTIVTSEKKWRQKQTNYSFWNSEDIRFDRSSKRVNFRGVPMSIGEFVDQMERNHLSDMFLFSRIKGTLLHALLHVFFFLGDAKYDRYGVLWQNERGIQQPQDNRVKPATDKPDPLFHYFPIYRNLLGVITTLLLAPLYFWSISLDTNFFSVSNPFIVASFFMLLFLLSIFSEFWFKFLTSDHLKALSLATIEFRGKLKKI